MLIISHFHISGDILAKSFKWIYAKCFLCRICPNIARRRLAREKHKERLRQNMVEDPVKSRANHENIFYRTRHEH
jgi:hypothetical protein